MPCCWIASITKLMTGLLIAEAHLPMDEVLTITQDDVDTEKHSSSRLRVGTQLTRGEMLHLALMSSENRAAHALGRTYPGGLQHFVQPDEQQGQAAGYDRNPVCRAYGLVQRQPIQRARPGYAGECGAWQYACCASCRRRRAMKWQWATACCSSTIPNSLVKSDRWDIGLQKTGYISEAGRCLAMQAEVAGRKLIDGVLGFHRVNPAAKAMQSVCATG